jgi:peptidoglycan/xylan/chitin deacetylase (PgdA/CDA1 family)
MTLEKKKTLILCIILVLCLAVLGILISLVAKNALTPADQDQAQYMEMPKLHGLSLSEAKKMLSDLNISYDVVQTENATINRVLNVEYQGKTENGKEMLEIGTKIKLYANEVGADKIVYLTFDDGPIVNYTYSMEIYNTTGKLLDVLDSYNIKASFFIVGYQMIKSDRSDYVLDIMNRGHILACHSSTHELRTIYDSKSNFVSDIERFENELKSIIGEEKFNSIGKYLRFPGGTTSNGILSKSEAKEYISAVREMGYKIYDWTALTGDAEGKSTAAEFIAYLESGLNKAKANGEPLIVLMHDKASTTEALPEILDYLISEGYYFDTIDNCPEFTFAENR